MNSETTLRPDPYDTACPPAVTTDRRSAWYHVALMLGVYAVIFGQSVFASAVTFLADCGLMSVNTANNLGLLDPQIQADSIGAGWVVLLCLVAISPPTIASWLTRTQNSMVLIAPLVLGTAAVYWIITHPMAFWSNVVAFYTGQMLLAVIMTAYVMQRMRLHPADLGVDMRRLRHDADGTCRAFAWSMAAFFAAALLGLSVQAVLHPSLGTSAAAQGSNNQWAWVVAASANAITEELVCTALLYVVLKKVGWSLWQICAMAAVLRVAFHLYLGYAGFGAALFAVTNLGLFWRRRQIISLIVAHALYDIMNNLNGGGVIVAFNATTAVRFSYPLIASVLAAPVILLISKAVAMRTRHLGSMAHGHPHEGDIQPPVIDLGTLAPSG